MLFRGLLSSGCERGDFCDTAEYFLRNIRENFPSSKMEIQLKIL